MAEEFSIRLANIDDMKNVFDLSNDDTVRQNSIHTEKIEWENHVKWFENRLKNTDSPFYIIESLSKDFIGQVRIDENDETIISISINKDFRGKGLASDIIKECSIKSKINEIFAYVKSGNIPSQNAFIKAGYQYISSNNNYLKYKFINTAS